MPEGVVYWFLSVEVVNLGEACDQGVKGVQIDAICFS